MSIFNKYIEYYINNQKKRINKLDFENKILKENIEREKRKKEYQEMVFEKEILKNDLLKSRYDKFIKRVENRGIIINVLNLEYKISIWENLYLYKNGNNIYSICNREKKPIRVFSKNESKIIDKELKRFDYSLIVIDVTSRNVKIQLRLNRK